jgi:hypothetical protein
VILDEQHGFSSKILSPTDQIIATKWVKVLVSDRHSTD